MEPVERAVRANTNVAISPEVSHERVIAVRSLIAATGNNTERIAGVVVSDAYDKVPRRVAFKNPAERGAREQVVDGARSPSADDLIAIVELN